MFMESKEYTVTEQEWLECTAPEPLIWHSENFNISKRKLKLFCCACARYQTKIPVEGALLADIEQLELEADELVPEITKRNRRNYIEYSFAGKDFRTDAYAASDGTAWTGNGANCEGWLAIKQKHTDLFRHIVGNPFRK